MNLRIPGWARNQPAPSDLYRYADGETPRVSIEVNSEPVPVAPARGFVKIERAWKAGDRIRLELPMPVRLVAAHEEVEADRGRLALERGPVVYCVEGVDNGGAVDSIRIDPAGGFTTEHRADLLGGVTVIQAGEVTAVPYYAWSNRGAGPMAVWLPAK